MRAVLLVLVGILCTSWLCAAYMPCAHVSKQGKVYNLRGLALKTGASYHGQEGDYAYRANWCEPSPDPLHCAPNGTICAYNLTGTWQGTLQTSNPADNGAGPDAEWTELDPLRPGLGVILTSKNGYFGPQRAQVVVHIACGDSTPGHELHIGQADLTKTMWRFEMTHPAACPITTGQIYPVSGFTLTTDRKSVRVGITIPSLPPRNESITVRVEHPYLESDRVTFTGPANGMNTTLYCNVRLSSSAPSNQQTFQAGLVVEGSFAIAYPPDGSITVTVVPGESHSGLSGGSVFLIILLVGIFCYVAGGCLWNMSKHGSRGMEACPNVGFWRQVWRYAKSGASWFARTITCGRYGGGASEEYTDIDDQKRSTNNSDAF